MAANFSDSTCITFYENIYYAVILVSTKRCKLRHIWLRQIKVALKGLIFFF
jgi:hypothetical protein